jgi:hypothetical protein
MTESIASHKEKLRRKYLTSILTLPGLQFFFLEINNEKLNIGKIIILLYISKVVFQF